MEDGDGGVTGDVGERRLARDRSEIGREIPFTDRFGARERSHTLTISLWILPNTFGPSSARNTSISVLTPSPSSGR